MPIGIMGRKSLALIDFKKVRGVYQQEKRRLKYICLCHEPPLPMISFGSVAYGFVGQPFSKQLYVTRWQDGGL